jgi:predicted transcriptional regulator
MTLRDLVRTFDLRVVSGQENLDREVLGCYTSDLLSDVMANSQKGYLWITLQVHQNIVAVATMRELAGVVLIGGRHPLSETVEKAKQEGIPLLTISLPAFELSGRLYEIGLRGLL